VIRGKLAYYLLDYARMTQQSLVRCGALGGAILLVVLAVSAPAAQERRGPQRLQDSAQPNPQEVRPASPDGDSPSATAGQLVRQSESRRILGLPVQAIMWIVGTLVALLVVAAVIARRPPWRTRAQGGGTYGRGPGA
jgi:hypothetical protein